MPATARTLDITVRLARPDEGHVIGQLAAESGKWEIVGMDWSVDPTPYWLIAEMDGIPWGCLQVLPGVPMGHLEFLCVPTCLDHRHRAKIVKRLLLTGLQTCKLAGAQFVSGVLHPGLDGYATVIEHRGGVKWFSGDVYLMRVTA